MFQDREYLLTAVKYVSSTNTAALSLRGRKGGEGKDCFEYPESGKENSSTPSAKTSASAGDGKRVGTRAKVQTSSVKRKRKLSESVNDERSQSQQRDHGKRVKGGNSRSSGTDEAKKLIQIPAAPVYKKRGPKPKYIKEAEAAHAAAVAAQKKQLASPKKKGKRKYTDIDGGAHNAAIESFGKEKKGNVEREVKVGGDVHLKVPSTNRNGIRWEKCGW